jgi:PEP-CTERM motif/Thioester domain
MRRHRRLPALACVGLALGLSLLSPSDANADVTLSNISLFDGGAAPTVYITYTGSSGSVDVYADPQTTTSTLPSGASGSGIPLYCIDTVHDNYLPTSYNVNVESSPLSFTTIPKAPLTNQQAANEVAWALEKASASNSSTDQAAINIRAATQLFIWSVIDQNFSVTIGDSGTGSVLADYNSLVALTGYTPDSTFSNYLPGAVFLNAGHVGNLFQDLAYAVPGGVQITSIATPEPSTMVIAGLGALGMIGYGWRNRRQARRASCP